MGLTGSFQFGGIQQSYKFQNLATRQVTTTLNRLQFPSLPCEMVWFKARAANAGIIYIGSSDVTSQNGIELLAGDVWGPIPITNVNLYWYVSTAAGDRLQYQVVW